MAARTSFSTMRPCGPEPWTEARSMPPSLAMRLASGEAKTRLPAACPAPFGFAAAPGRSEPGRRGHRTCGRRRRPRWRWPAAGVRRRVPPAPARPRPSAPEPAAPPPAGAVTLFGSSPSPAISAMSWLTGTSAVPSGTTILARMPSSTASTSMVALSVSISAMTSPDFTVSPSFFSHLARLPFSMVGDRAGIRILMGMALMDPDLRGSS